MFYKDKIKIKGKEIHKNKYDYSLIENNINSRSTVKIICPIHGIFEQSVRSHFSNGSGCPKCAVNNIKKSLTKDKKYFIEKSKKIHGDKYDYKLVDYKTSRNHNVKIICPIHGIFEQTPSNHHKGFGCPICGNINCANKLKKTTEEFIIDAKKIHGDKYDYSLVKYAIEKIKIICPIHGIFEQNANKHLNNRGCPYCNESKGERIIFLYLKQNNIKFKRQKLFNNCKDINRLPFDFYLISCNMCIEYDGIQHFEPIEYFGGDKQFEIIQKHDKIKNNFCEENNINLLRISYKENIIEKLSTII